MWNLFQQMGAEGERQTLEQHTSRRGKPAHATEGTALHKDLKLGDSSAPSRDQRDKKRLFLGSVSLPGTEEAAAPSQPSHLGSCFQPRFNPRPAAAVPSSRGAAPPSAEPRAVSGPRSRACCRCSSVSLLLRVPAPRYPCSSGSLLLSVPAPRCCRLFPAHPSAPARGRALWEPGPPDQGGQCRCGRSWGSPFGMDTPWK